jgi:hypothetical protein
MASHGSKAVAKGASAKLLSEVFRDVRTLQAGTRIGA